MCVIVVEEPHYPEKNTGFAHESISPVNSHVSALLHFPTELKMGGWHDDVVGMIVCMLFMTIVRNSDVF